jgi:hypothetical protein
LRQRWIILAGLLSAAAQCLAQGGEPAVRTISGAGGRSVAYRADEADLEEASYVLQHEAEDARAILNWRNGLLRFTGVARGEDLMDEEGLKTEARNSAYVAAQEFIEGVIVGREAAYAKAGLSAAEDDAPGSRDGVPDGRLIRVGVPSDLIRTGPVIDRTFTYEPHPTIANQRIARAEVTVALLVYNAEFPDQSILGRMLPSLRSRLTDGGVRPATAPTPAVIEQLTAAGSAPGSVTGLILDARGHRMRPVAAPEVYVQGEEARLLYGALQAEPAHVSRHGLAGWCRTEEEARDLARAGSQPLLVRIADSLGPDSGAVLVSPDDAARIMAADAQSPFLGQCRVVFIVD